MEPRQQKKKVLISGGKVRMDGLPLKACKGAKQHSSSCF